MQSQIFLSFNLNMCLHDFYLFIVAIIFFDLILQCGDHFSQPIRVNIPYKISTFLSILGLMGFLQCFFAHFQMQQEEATARNRILASTMLNNNNLRPKLTPLTNYSAPTCHTTLQRNKQKIEAEIITKPSFLQNGYPGLIYAKPSFTLGPNPFPSKANELEETVGYSSGYLQRNELDFKLARTWSVGKLVSSIETFPPNALEDAPPTSHGLSSPGSRSGSKLSNAAIQLSNGTIKPFPAPKPPMLLPGPKPVLRHTVRP